MKQLSEKSVLIIGLGLIGGSIARALRSRGLCREILAYGRNAERLNVAKEQGVIDDYSTDLATISATADIIIVAVPVLSFAAVFATLADSIAVHTVITDAASVKRSVVDEFEAVFPGSFRNFVPGHPIAGSELSGYAASRQDLFESRRVILTPTANSGSEAVNVVAGLWRSLGAEVLAMDVDRHDEVLAATSHLPHLLAYALVNTLANSNLSEDIFRYAAGGFADFSRIASSDPIMWRDIFMANSQPTVAVLDALEKNLSQLRQAITSSDGAYLEKQFRDAKNTRDGFIFTPTGDHSAVDAPAQTPTVDFLARPAGKLSGELRVPGDKSISHRCIIFAAIADGVTRVSGFLEGEDALHTLQAFRELGVLIVGPQEGKVTIYGVGKHGLRAPSKPLYLGNSGTAMRLMCGLLAAQSFDSELTGDESLSSRPMQRVTDPLRLMGANLHTAQNGTAPIKISRATLKGIDYVMPIASAQVKSSIMLAAIYASGETRITEPASCRDHTERMLKGFNYPVQTIESTREIIISGDSTLAATNIDIPADISSAAFFLVAASICPDSNLVLRHVGVNPTRTGIINLLRLMGADIQLSNEINVGGEPVADISVRYSALKGIAIPESQIPLAIDEFPVLFIAAACARGTTILRGAEELRVKESDRIQVMADGLLSLGIEVEVYADGIRIEGGQIRGGAVNSHADHRIAMAFTVASLRAQQPIQIADCANVATSFPNFLELAGSVGFEVSQIDRSNAKDA